MPADERKNLIAEIKAEIVLTQKAMQSEMQVAVENKIEKTVNGKINAMRDVLDAHVKTADTHRQKVDEFITLMSPAAEGIRMFATLRKAAVWLSGFGIIGTIIWLGVKSFLGR